MIVNLERFVAAERPKWEQLDALLSRIAKDPWRRLPFEEVRELEGLYQRAAADLARLAAFSAEPEARERLEAIVGRAFTEIHGSTGRSQRFHPWDWLSRTLPQTFRRRIRPFGFAAALCVAGIVFGSAAITLDPQAKPVLITMQHLQGDPAERVGREERSQGRELEGHKATFSGMLMTHNTQVTLAAMALGMTWGIGTMVFMFYNGVMIGAVAADYVTAGESRFLLGWLLPHGVIEIPAMLIGGQAGFVLAGALLGRGQRERVAQRLRAVVPDVVTLCFGASVMLAWAGTIEAFFSQYHEPVLPYGVKIAFGCAELVALIAFFTRAGRSGGRQGP